MDVKRICLNLKMSQTEMELRIDNATKKKASSQPVW